MKNFYTPNIFLRKIEKSFTRLKEKGLDLFGKPPYFWPAFKIVYRLKFTAYSIFNF